MTQNGPGSGSFDDSREGGTPSPFSREGSAPGDALGADPRPPAPAAPTPASSYAPPGSSNGAHPLPPASAASAAEQTRPWPTYPGADPATTAPPVPQPPSGPAPYGASSYDPYAGAPPTSGYTADQIPPYGSATYDAPPAPYPPTAAYGSNPYDTNAYQVNPYGSSSPYGVVAQQHPQSTLAMIMGILGLAVCPAFAIPGLVLGSKARKQIDAEPYRYTGRGMATAGYVLGIIGIVYLALWVLFLILGISGSLGS